MQTIYERRSQRPTPVPGVVELARSLASYPHAALVSTSVAVDGRFVFVWLALDESEVLGCVVGRDRRSDPDQPHDR